MEEQRLRCRRRRGLCFLELLALQVLTHHGAKEVPGIEPAFPVEVGLQVPTVVFFNR